jgi:2-oxoglutarate ferredoxin oxidoreductase subunit delta
MPEYLKLKDRWKIESFRKLGEDVVLGTVEIDRDKCRGCGLCVGACAASALELKDKKVKMIDVLPACMSCGDCVAICSRGALKLKGYLQLKRYFRYLDRGEPSLPRKF